MLESIYKYAFSWIEDIGVNDVIIVIVLSANKWVLITILRAKKVQMCNTSGSG